MKTGTSYLAYWICLCYSLSAALLAVPSPSNAINWSHERRASSSAAHRHIEQRGSHHLGQGWWLHYNTFSSLLPWHVAAEGIENFFQTIIERANGEWLSQNPQHYLEIAKGDLKIEFYSELAPITWQFIAQYASIMCHALDLGFAAMFDMRLVTPTGMVLYVHLRVKQALAAIAA